MNEFANFSNEKTNPFQNSKEMDFEFDEFVVTETVPKESEFRLNDYDSNLLSEDAYKKLDDEVFKLEYKINKIEKKIKALTTELNSANNLGEVERAQFLFEKRRQYEIELSKLYQIYKTQSLPTNLSESVISFVLNVPKNIVQLITQLLKPLHIKFLNRIFDKINSKTNIRATLQTLENINRNVDELVSMRSPYGESEEKYNQLLNYLNKANHIQSQIAKITKK